jgi:hypothetical protein
MKKVLTFSLAALMLLLSACTEQVVPLDSDYYADEDGFVISRTEEPDEITEEEYEYKAEEFIIDEEPGEASHFIMNDYGIFEINLTKLFPRASEVHLKAVGERYIFALDWGSAVYVFDLEQQEIVNTVRFPGTLRRGFNEFGDGVYVYSAKQVTPTPNYTEEHFITYIFPDNSWTDSLGDEWIRAIIGNRILRHIDGGIFEDINGELVELLPPIGEFEHFDEDGNWRPNFAAVWHRFTAQLDDDRFIYNKGGYEWTWGFGVYDFAAGRYTDMPDTNSLYVVGFKDNIVFTQFAELSAFHGLFATNIDTLETVYFLNDEDFPQKELPWEEADERWTMPMLESFALSPDKNLIAAVDYDLNVYIISAESGALEQTIRVDALYKEGIATNSIYVDFLGNDRVIVFDQKWHMRDQRALIITLNS